jgi:hypothetical protein
MGPTLRTTKSRPKYDDAILRLAQEDEDGAIRDATVAHARGRGRGRGRGKGRGRGRGKGKGGAEVGSEMDNTDPQLLVDGMDQLRLRREKQRKERLTRNDDERQSHDMDVFFNNPPPVIGHQELDPRPITPPALCPLDEHTTPPIEPQYNPPTTAHRVSITSRIVRTPGSPFGRPQASALNLTPSHNRNSQTRKPSVGAPDVWEFFNKGSAAKGTKTICKTCRYVKKILLCYVVVLNSCFSPVVMYSPLTSTGSLRVHIEACHAYEYLQACRSKGWPIKIKSLAAASKSNDVDSSITPRAPFSIARFKAALVNWIVADDQVRCIIPFYNFNVHH